MKIHSDDCPALGSCPDHSSPQIIENACTCRAQQALDELVSVIKTHLHSCPTPSTLEAALKPFLEKP